MAALKVTEPWIRNRVQLQHQNLADVRSLSLPGAYQEKITHLGSSLKSFIRLKSLDLSRNALVSLEGIQHLKLLEKLNLYYNNVPSLIELFHLRNLNALKELDLRLNPVAKNEPDYRLFVVHMLPNLRRLDDRPVRDSERKAALMQFSTEQAHDFLNPPPPAGKESERSGQPRVDYVSSMSKKCSMLDEEDEAVLNLIAKCGWDLSKPPGITGSTKNAPEAQLYTLRGIRKIDAVASTAGGPASEGKPVSQQSRAQQVNIPKVIISSEQTHPLEHDLNEEYQALPSCSPSQSVSRASALEMHERGRDGVRVKFADDRPRDLHAADPNLKFQDEFEAYHRVISKAHFTPHPGTSDATKPSVHSRATSVTAQQRSSLAASAPEFCSSTLPVNGRDRPLRQPKLTSALQKQNEQSSTGPVVTAESRRMGTEKQNYREVLQRVDIAEHQTNGPDSVSSETKKLVCNETQHTVPLSVNSNLFDPTPMERLLDLVDKYWNGFKSLHCNETFLTQARQTISTMQKSVAVDGHLKDGLRLEDEIVDLKAEKQALYTHLSQQEHCHSAELQRLTEQHSQAQRDMGLLKERLEEALQENSNLKNRLIKLEQKAANVNAPCASDFQLIELKNHNQQLKMETDNLKQQLQHYAKIEELTEMLQEGHRTLVSTNEHLLQELEEARSRHKTEVEQLHWSYNQLKKTIEIVPHCKSPTKENTRQ
ncbi:centrosomal protein of 72 kDa [Latimeria chalumnae]|uniref:centrosomal protein of 72 kDa n=1 Tax=Latimeria chalumnae TaxID=7897 RepID=UPI0003C1A8CF|nr:PREDICTED: centrosomal protein of 72 kDa isoform X1 [Latimeria chalumnae]|eukprot:XP_006008534.1 PREDICTED: centrosomal protein of 72 kDa isoform X1 [Latimeria chalumnae]